MGVLRAPVAFAMSNIASWYVKKVDKKAKRIMESSETTLKLILELNKNTEYGQRYNFAAITSREHYSNTVPIVAYPDIKSHIDRVINTGDKNVLTAETPEAFFVSSGTTAAFKTVPATARTIRLHGLFCTLIPHGFILKHVPAARKYNRGLFLFDLILRDPTPLGLPVSAAPSIGMQKMKKMYSFGFTTPVDVLHLTQPADVSYVHLLFALKERSLGYIGAAYCSGVLDLFKKLENKWQQLIDNIARGEMPSDLCLPEDIRIKVQNTMKPDAKRARELSVEFEKGLEGIAARIWPEICFIQTVFGAGFKMYADELRFYTGSVPLYSSCYGGCEGMVGVSTAMERPYYALLPIAVYPEFIPSDEFEKEQPRTVTIDKLKVGEVYETVITNFSGLYRYRMGDVIKVVDYYHQAPEIEFLYRRGNLLNVAAEKTSEDALRNAIYNTCEKLGCTLVDYTSMANTKNTPNNYIVFLELINLQPGEQSSYIRDMLDVQLGKENPFYEHWQLAGKLGPLDLRLVRPDTFRDLRQKFIERGSPEVTLKVPRRIEGDDMISFMRENTSVVLQKTKLYPA